MIVYSLELCLRDIANTSFYNNIVYCNRKNVNIFKYIYKCN